MKSFFEFGFELTNWFNIIALISRGGYSREFWIEVCREGSWTLTLFKD